MLYEVITNKPFNLDELSIIVKKALETRNLRKEVAHLRSAQTEKYGIENIIRNNFVEQTLYEVIRGRRTEY